MSLIPLEVARAEVLARCAPLPPVRWPLDEARGCVAAESVGSTEQVPAFDNTAMDGYAVRAADTAGAVPGAEVRLRTLGRLLAGAESAVEVGPGEALRIMTGAPLPSGADAVVPVEATTALPAGTDGVDHEQVAIAQQVEVGRHVRRAGDDVEVGDVVVAAGTRLGPAHLGVLAGVGAASVAVHPRPRVGVLSTGDELVDGPWPVGPGQLRDTNRITLRGLLARDGYEAVDLGHVPDDEDAIVEAVRTGVRSCDLVLSTGGVSMGDVDLVKVVLDRMGDMRWLQVAIRPAKPFAHGTVSPGRGRRGIPVLGLPGNPVSAAVSYELLARPALRRLAGRADAEVVPPTTVGEVAEPLERRSDGKVHFVRVVLDRGAPVPRVRPVVGQGSHQLSALAAADALAVVPDGDGLATGDPVELLLLG